MVAYATAKGYVVVTQEQFDPNIRGRIPIPNACQPFSVPYVDTIKIVIPGDQLFIRKTYSHTMIKSKLFEGNNPAKKDGEAVILNERQAHPSPSPERKSQGGRYSVMVRRYSRSQLNSSTS